MDGVGVEVARELSAAADHCSPVFCSAHCIRQQSGGRSPIGTPVVSSMRVEKREHAVFDLTLHFEFDCAPMSIIFCHCILHHILVL